MDVWERIRRADQPSRTVLSGSRIAAVAVEIADTEGLDAVSMRKVAQRLNAGAMSLYHYVSSRDDLVKIMIDHVYASFPIAERSDAWRTDLAGIAHRIRDIVLEHPWLAGRSVARMGVGPNILRMLESSLALVDGYGLTADQVVDVLATIDAFVQGHVLAEITELREAEETKLTKAEVQQRQESNVVRLMEANTHPHFVRVAAESTDDGGRDEVFGRRLRYVLDGLAPVFVSR